MIGDGSENLLWTVIACLLAMAAAVAFCVAEFCYWLAGWPGVMTGAGLCVVGALFFLWRKLR